MQFTTFILLSITGLSFAKPTTWTNPTTQKVIHPDNNNSKCLSAASNADGAAVILRDCKPNDPSQLWTPTGGTFQIFGNKCLDDTNGDTTNGKKMQIYTCSKGNKNQQWFNSGTTIGLSGTKKCLDNTGGKMTSGNPAQIWDCTGGNNQKWNVVNASAPTGTGKSISPGKSSKVCLTAASNTNNAAVTIQNCDKSAGQQWTVTNGNLQIFGNKCLDVPNGSTQNGQKMQIYTCVNGNTNQLFTVTGDKRIAWTNKGECLDLTNGSTTPGNKIQMWKCTDNNQNQVWNISS